MMRIALGLTALILLALPVHAQDDGCTQANPCPWLLEVDASGFVGEASHNWTLGDWVQASIVNDDSVSHTISLGGSLGSMPVAGGGEADKTFHLQAKGSFNLADQPSGDTAAYTVTDNAATHEAGTTPTTPSSSAASGPGTSTTQVSSMTGKRTPSLELPLLVLGLALVATARRR